MYVTLLGPICAGKSIFARYLQKYYQFKIIDLVELFKIKEEVDIEEYISNKNKAAIKLCMQSSTSTHNSELEENKEEAKIEGREHKFLREFYLDPEGKKEVTALVEKVIALVKSDWKNNYVIFPIANMDDWENILYRHTFIVYEIEAPITSRYERFCSKYDDELTFAEFAKLNDQLIFDTDYMRAKEPDRRDKVKKVFTNTGSSEDLIGAILKYDFSDYRIVRPDWDQYFMRLAHVAASRSNCMKRSVGAIIVNPDKQIVATGYNGTTFGFDNCFSGGCKRCNNPKVTQGESLELCVCIHAEENAILIAGRVQTKECSLYATAYPCGLCAKFIIQSGIKKIYYDSDYKSEVSKDLFKKCGVEVQRVVPYLSDN
jgi:dCMP deaminase